MVCGIWCYKVIVMILCIFVVDDDIVFVEMIGIVLCIEGFELVFCVDGVWVVDEWCV